MHPLDNEDADQVWYKTEWLDDRPNELPLHRHVYSAVWQQDIHLTRCTDENEGEFYKVPRDAYDGFERIQIDDNIGTMLMNGKTYLAFDELMLYIGTTKRELQKYQIERVNCIE